MLVLYVGLNACGTHCRIAPHGVIQFHRFSVVRQRIARRIPPFPFGNIVANQLRLTAHTPLQCVAFVPPGAAVGEGYDPRFQTVAGMLVKYTGSQGIGHPFCGIDGGGGVISCREYVLAGNVEVLPFVGVESACVKTDLHFIRYLAFRAECRKGSEETVFFLSVVVDRQVLGILSAEGLGEAVRLKTVVVLAHVA